MYSDDVRIATRVIHGAPHAGVRSLTPPIYQSSVYYAASVAGAVALEESAEGVTSYSRTSNPTVLELERALAALEGADQALATPSGMAALTLAFLALLGPADRVAVSPHSYADTLAVLEELAAKVGFEVLLFDFSDPTAYSDLQRRKVTFAVVETPSNPMLRIADLSALSRCLRSQGATLLIDSTLATPINQRPLDLGADLVVHSASKYLTGHHNALAGSIAGRTDLISRLRDLRTITGLCLDPHSAWLVLQGLQTLAIRVERQNATAQRIAEFLVRCPEVEFVAYPGLPDDPGADIAARQMTGCGGVLTFGLRQAERVVEFLESLRLCTIAVSLGGTKTLIESPRLMSHVQGGPHNASLRVIPANAIRLSVGLEDADDIVADLAAGLGKLTPGDYLRMPS